MEAEHRGAHRVWLRFSDGVEGEVDLAAELAGDVFAPLRDERYFASFILDDTLTWPNGADFSPEFLHRLVRRTHAHERRMPGSWKGRVRIHPGFDDDLDMP